jgi:protein-S-isoprenylcysteine O-methyltransferase Ste14
VIDSGAMRTILPAMLLLVVVFLLFLLVPGLKDQPWTVSRVTGATLAVIGYAFAVTARIQLGRSFSFRPEAKGLVTHGLYSRIRNPMYTFLDVMVFGLILALRLYWLFVLVAVLMFFQVRQADREANILHDKFGHAYLDYRKQTWF